MEIAGGAIAIVQITGKIVSQIKRAREFWQDVNEAPEEVQSVISDLELLSSILTGFALSEQQREGPPDPDITNALQSCLKHVDSFRRFMDEFELGFNSDRKIRRKWSACKVAYKEKKLQKFGETLEKAKTNLIIALTSRRQALPQQTITTTCTTSNQLNTEVAGLRQEMSEVVISAVSASTRSIKTQIMDQSEHIQNELTSIRGELPAISTRVEAAPDEVCTALRNNINSYNPGLTSPLLGMGLRSSLAEVMPRVTRRIRRASVDTRVTQNYQVSHISNAFGRTTVVTKRRCCSILAGGESIDRDETTTSYIYHPAPWLLRTGFRTRLEFAIYSSQGGWKFGLTTKQMVPNDSLVFHLSSCEDVEGLRDLFIKGKASAHDVDLDGRTPLHCAVVGGKVETCKFLISCGADKRALDSDGDPPLFYVSPLSHNNSKEILHIFDDTIDSLNWGAADFNRAIGLLLSGTSAPDAFSSFVAWVEEWAFQDFCGESHIVRWFLHSILNEFALFCSSGRVPLNAAERVLKSNLGQAYSCVAQFFLKIEESVDARVFRMFIENSPGYAYRHFLYFQIRGSYRFGIWAKLFRQAYSEGPEGILQQHLSEIGGDLQHTGWSFETLQDLFALSELGIFRSDTPGNRRQCLRAPIMEPWWEGFKQLVMQQRCICPILQASEGHSSTAKNGQDNIKDPHTQPPHDRNLYCQYCRHCHRNHRACHAARNHGEYSDVLWREPISYSNRHSELVSRLWNECHKRYAQRDDDDERSISLEIFHEQGYRWHGKYRQGEVFCTKCLGVSEGWWTEGDIYGYSDSDTSKDSQGQESDEGEDGDEDDDDEVD